MSHYEWTELDYVAGAAHELHLSYGQYVAQGCPHLQRFKRRVERGEFDAPKKTRGTRTGKKTISRRMKTSTFVCQQCGKAVTYSHRSGPVKIFCTDCATKRQRENMRMRRERVRAEKVLNDQKEG